MQHSSCSMVVGTRLVQKIIVSLNECAGVGKRPRRTQNELN